ncbi:hypothetical protein ACN4EG_21140 [Alkalinema pantanalense CENA528]|uniref:hypothetical protein n=1 Tax=Alkalinema pantanalense TaxID=1620705 RepID=UPI003D6F80B6
MQNQLAKLLLLLLDTHIPAESATQLLLPLLDTDVGTEELLKLILEAREYEELESHDYEEKAEQLLQFLLHNHVPVEHATLLLQSLSEYYNPLTEVLDAPSIGYIGGDYASSDGALGGSHKTGTEGGSAYDE